MEIGSSEPTATHHLTIPQPGPVAATVGASRAYDGRRCLRSAPPPASSPFAFVPITALRPPQRRRKPTDSAALMPLDSPASPSPLPPAPAPSPAERSAEADAPARPHYLLVDGENIDTVLGNTLLGGKPTPQQRPQWDQVRTFLESTFGTPFRMLFFLHYRGPVQHAFIQAITAIGYRPVLLTGPDDVKVVDEAIIRTLGVLVTDTDASSTVVLASHDGMDFAEPLRPLTGGARRVALLGFEECMSERFRVLDGVEIFDLEYDAHAFKVELPRLRPTDIADFDPRRYL